MNNPFETISERLNTIELLLNEIKAPKKESENKLHSVKELSDKCGVAELTVRNWITDGKVKAQRLGRRIFIEEEEFQKALSEVKSIKYKRN